MYAFASSLALPVAAVLLLGVCATSAPAATRSGGASSSGPAGVALSVPGAGFRPAGQFRRGPERQGFGERVSGAGRLTGAEALHPGRDGSGHERGEHRRGRDGFAYVAPGYGYFGLGYAGYGAGLGAEGDTAGRASSSACCGPRYPVMLGIASARALPPAIYVLGEADARRGRRLFPKVGRGRWPAAQADAGRVHVSEAPGPSGARIIRVP